MGSLITPFGTMSFPSKVIKGEVGTFDCYKLLSVEIEDFASSRWETAATTQCLAMD